MSTEGEPPPEPGASPGAASPTPASSGGAPSDVSADRTPAKKSSNRKWIVLAVAGGGCLLSIPCIGILAAIAIPAFTGYVKKSKVAEAEANMALLTGSVLGYCDEHGRVPSAAGPLPRVPTNEKQLVPFSADPGFRDVGFDPGTPVYFSYALVPEGTDAITLLVEGDLDGDGTRSRFAMECRHAAGGCHCGSIVRENELE